ncbi:MAG: nitroreductase family protein [Paracoccaceae bacterium]
MPKANSEVLDFLRTRRSRPAKSLGLPVPDEAALAPIFEAGLRVPDHGKLEPWRLIVLQGEALARLAALTEARATEMGHAAEQIAKSKSQFADAGLVVAVISSPVISEKVPQVEQILSAGAVCLSLLNAAAAAGWGANWLSGWMALDPAFLQQGLELAPDEFVAGFIHIGTERAAPPERPRPDIAAKTSWMRA